MSRCYPAPRGFITEHAAFQPPPDSLPRKRDTRAPPAAHEKALRDWAEKSLKARDLASPGQGRQCCTAGPGRVLQRAPRQRLQYASYP